MGICYGLEGRLWGDTVEKPKYCRKTQVPHRQLSFTGSLVNSAFANSMTCEARFWLDIATENIGEASIEFFNSLGHHRHSPRHQPPAAKRRNRTFTPRLERGRASNFAGDSATAERSAGQDAHPSGLSASSTGAFPRKVNGFLTRFAILLLERQARRALYGYTSSQDSEKDRTCGT